MNTDSLSWASLIESDTITRLNSIWYEVKSMFA
jgi:hypothetical protein